MENGDTFKNCKKRRRMHFTTADFTCQMDCNSTTVENHRFQNVKTLPFILVLLLCLSSVILKFDCAAHLRKICAQLRQNFALLHQNFLLLLCSKSFRGDFISTYLRSLWISNLKLVSEQRKQSNKKQPKLPIILEVAINATTQPNQPKMAKTSQTVNNAKKVAKVAP